MFAKRHFTAVNAIAVVLFRIAQLTQLDSVVRTVSVLVVLSALFFIYLKFVCSRLLSRPVVNGVSLTNASQCLK